MSFSPKEITQLFVKIGHRLGSQSKSKYTVIYDGTIQDIPLRFQIAMN